VQLTEFSENRQNSFRRGDHTAIKVQMFICIYTIEVCNLTERDLQSLDFTINRFRMKLFRTSDANLVTECQSSLNFHFQIPNVLLEKRRENLSMYTYRCDGSLYAE